MNNNSKFRIVPRGVWVFSIALNDHIQFNRDIYVEYHMKPYEGRVSAKIIDFDIQVNFFDFRDRENGTVIIYIDETYDFDISTLQPDNPLLIEK